MRLRVLVGVAEGGYEASVPMGGFERPPGECEMGGVLDEPLPLDGEDVESAEIVAPALDGKGTQLVIVERPELMRHFDGAFRVAEPVPRDEAAALTEVLVPVTGGQRFLAQRPRARCDSAAPVVGLTDDAFIRIPVGRGLGMIVGFAVWDGTGGEVPFRELVEVVPVDIPAHLQSPTCQCLRVAVLDELISSRRAYHSQHGRIWLPM